MTNNKQEKQHFTKPLQFSQSELDARLSKAKDQYLCGHYKSYANSAGSFVYPATELFTFHNIEELVDLIAEQAKQGRERFKGEPMRVGVGYFEVRIYKSQEDQESDLKVIYEDVEAKYRQELQDDLEAKKALLTEQLYNQQIAKEEKEKQKKLDAAKAKAAQEAEEYIQSLMKGE